MKTTLVIGYVLCASARPELHVAVTKFSTPSELANLRWGAISHLHQAINPLIVSQTGEVAPSQPSTWPQPSLVEAAHDNGAAILVPLHLSTKSAAEIFFEHGASTIDAAARQAVAKVRNGGYDGLSIDIEGLKPESKQGFEAFVTACASALL